MIMEKDIIELFKQVKPERVVETGTNNGDGTTKMLWNARVAAGLTTKIVTIECNPTRHQTASNYFKSNGMEIDARLGLSIPRHMIPDRAQIKREFVDNEDNKGGKIYYDHSVKDRVELYFGETNFNVKDELLKDAIVGSDVKTSIFLLDSAGHVGSVEFNYLLGIAAAYRDKVTSPFWLILDDTRHCKHVRTLEIIRNFPRNRVIVDSPERFGYAIAEIVI